jgi:hypothetical protein
MRMGRTMPCPAGRVTPEPSLLDENLNISKMLDQARRTPDLGVRYM